MFEGIQQLHVSLGSFDRDDISIQALNGCEDIIEIGVAEVGVGLELVSDTSSGQLEGVDGPSQVGIPVGAAQRELMDMST
jgi:hypothetical protein